LFRDVELQPRDDTSSLAAAGLKLRRFRRQEQGAQIEGRRFNQPCTALGCDLKCAVYALRPEHCRGFDCALLQSYRAGAIEEKAAVKTIRQTRKRADQIRRLLEELGQTDRHLPLTRRFQRLQRQIVQEGLPPEIDAEVAAERFGDLVAAVGELQLALRLAFYPDAP
jgi:hypothetical protein